MDMADEELRRRVQFLERKLAQMEDDAAIQRRKDDYTMATLGKRNLQNNVTMDLMFAGNLVWNSSFEMPSTGALPTYWTGGVSSAQYAFIGTVSLKLTAGQISEQTTAAYIPIVAFGNEQIRVTFAQLGGKVRCEVLDQSGIAMLSDDFNLADSWYNGRRTITVKPGTATSVHLRFTNIDTTNAVYIDAVQVEPDVLRKWPSLYMDGPKSGAYASEVIGGFGLGLGGVGALLKVVGLMFASGANAFNINTAGTIQATATAGLNSRIDLAYMAAVDWYLGAILSDALAYFHVATLENTTSGDIADPLIGSIGTSAIFELNPPS